MNFNEWLNTLDLANLNDLQPNDGMEMGWFECKKQVLKTLKECDEFYRSAHGSDGFRVGEDAIKRIEKL